MTHTSTYAAAHATAGAARAALIVASGNAVFRRRLLDRLAGAPADALPVLEAVGGADALLKLELAPCAGLILDRQIPDLDADELKTMLDSQYPALAVEVINSAAALDWFGAAESGADWQALVRAVRDGAAATEAAGPAAPAPRRQPPAAARSECVASPSPRGTAAAPQAELLPGLVGASQHLYDLANLVRLVAPRRTSVLILGETGTGKEMIAHALHRASLRAQRPWVVVNCAAIPEALLESELFGFARGAFTGAVQARTGRIQTAHTGTLFLDEIGELPLNLQSKLLRFLQEGELQRLGGNEPQKVDVRVVAATNVDLLAKVEAGAFRRDLYYRLAVFPIELQALRQRPTDVLPLADYFLRQLQAGQPGPAPELTLEAMDLLERYPWPGNVRELQHALERAHILAAGDRRIQSEHFPVALAWQHQRGMAPARAGFEPATAQELAYAV